jgi:type IV pilus assembly protein PilC
MVIAFTRQLYVLMKAGIPLLKALQIIYAQLPDGKFKENIELVIRDIQEGKSFSESLSFSPKFFSLFYINMIKTSEVSGNLVGTLKELSQHLIQNRRISRQVQSAFMYPAFILIITIVILAALLMVVLPTFTRIFADFGGKLPTITLLLIGLSKFTVRWGWLFLLSLIVAAGAMSLLYRKTTGGRRIFNIAIWRLPLFGRLIKTIEIAMFCRILGTMLSSGVTLVKSLEVLFETTQSALLRQALEDIRDKVEQGKNLSLAMEESGIFALTLVKMIQVGEESGKIAELFLDAAEDYEEEVSFLVSGLLSLLEPVLIVIMGAIVGFVVIALFFPIFTISGAVK